MKTKTYKIIGIVVLAYLVVSLIVYYAFIRVDVSIFLDPNLHIKYDGNNWGITYNEEGTHKDYNTYENANGLGKLDIRLSLETGRWGAYESGVKKNSNGSLIAFKGNKKINFINYEESESAPTDEAIINEYFKTKSLAYKANECYINTYKLDLNGDGLIDTIYIINSKTEEYSLKEAFSAIIINDTTLTHELLFKIADNTNWYNVGSPMLFKMLDIRADKRYEMFFKVVYYGNSKMCDLIVETTAKEFKNVTNC